MSNAAITAADIVNYSAKSVRRVDTVFGIGYGDSIAKARQIIGEIFANDDRARRDLGPTIAVCELADSSVNLVVRPWVKNQDYWGVSFNVAEAVKLGFEKQAVSIPFPR